MLRHLPNTLTLLRLLLALPLGHAILQQDYSLALMIGLIAGLTDALDGFLARRLNALSPLGAALDPVADKALITTGFLCFALVELIPWYLALIVIGRDLVIVVGASCYTLLIGRFEFAATRLSKINMLLQIVFCLLLLIAQVLSGFPQGALSLTAILVVVFALASGLDYVVTWTIKALDARRRRQL